MSDHIASRLAIHESCHAVAMFLLGMPIHSIEIGENEGVVHHPSSDDSFDLIVSLLAPHRFEQAMGWQPSGDDYDEKEVERILRRHVSAAAIPQARAVLEEAADQLVVSGTFDTLRHALSPHLGPGSYLTGEEVEEILHEALQQHAELYRKAWPSLERHSTSGGWWIVTVPGPGGRMVYRGSDQHEAKRVQRREGGTLTGSIYG